MTYYYQIIKNSEYLEGEILQSLREGKCSVYMLHEEYSSSSILMDNQIYRKITNCELIVGSGMKCAEDCWGVDGRKENESCDLLNVEENVGGEKVVGLNVLRFEIIRNELHTTIYDVVFLNSWYKQYYTVCCERFSEEVGPEYKTQIYSSLRKTKGFADCYSKYFQYQQNFIQKQHSDLCKFQPSFQLVIDLIDTIALNHKTLSKKQIKCLIVICQQIPLSSRVDFDKLIKEVQEWKCNSNLFSEMNDYQWEDDQDLLNIFKCWCCYPLQSLTQPEITMKLELVTESSNIYRYLMCSKFGNILAGQNLVEIFEFGIDEFMEIALDCKVPQNRNIEKSNRFPFVLLWHNQTNSISVDESEKDPRVWCYGGKSTCNQYETKLFDNLLFGEDWYSLYLFTKSIRFSNIEDFKRLKQVNRGYYYHLKRQTSSSVNERLQFSKLAILNGICEDVNLLLVSKSVSEEEKKEWETVVEFLNK